MEYNKVLVIGAGPGGYSTAGDLIMKGFNVALYEFPEYRTNIFPLIESGRIKMTGEISGIVTSPRIETKIDIAIINADIILVVTHSAAHKKVAEAIAPFIKDNQIIVLLPGYTGGTLSFERIFREKNVSANYILAETNTLPYACNKITGESAVHIKLYLKQVLASAFPSSNNLIFFEIFKALYPNVHLVENVLEVGFNNGNPVLNVLPCLFNAVTIEKEQDDYYHFQDGVNPRIAKVMEKMDKERMQIGQALGIRVIPYLERVIHTGYVVKNSTWYEMISTSPHLTAKGPENLSHRYLTEDVPYGLVPWYFFAKKMGIEANLIASSIELASSLLDINFLKEGRTLKEMGINDMNLEQLIDFL